MNYLHNSILSTVEKFFCIIYTSHFMSVSAYIFFLVELGKSPGVIDQLRKIPEIVSVAVVTGNYDVIAKIIVENLEELYEIATQKIHMIEGIQDTHTAVIEKEVLIE